MTVTLAVCVSCGRKAESEVIGNEVAIGHLTGWTRKGDGWRCPTCENATSMCATWQRRRKKDDRIFAALWALLALVYLTVFVWSITR